MLLLFVSVPFSTAQSTYECHCAEIGIDTAWAQANQVSCYRVPVNLIYNEPAKGQKSLAVIRAKSIEASNQEPLVYLHGGPGIAVLDVAQKYLSGNNWTRIRKQQDIIMFDYSGTGHSEPSLCEDILVSISALDNSNLTKEEKLQKTIQLHMDCRDSLQLRNIDINAFSTFQMAADADTIRQALGIDKWSVYGVSYGSAVAMSVMRHFSANVTGVVLDSPFPPNAESFSFVSTLNETFNHMQEVLNSSPATASQFPDIIADFAASVNRLNEHPAVINSLSFSGDDFAEIIFYTFYKTQVVPLIPLALKEFAAGNYELLEQWISALHAEGEYGKENDIHNAAIYCYECKPRTYRETPGALARRYPHLRALAAKDFMEICSAFRPEFPDASYYEPVESNLPVLVLAGEFDPGCPVSYAYSAIEKMPNAQLVVVPNASHAGMHYNECTLALIATFLEAPGGALDVSCINQISRRPFPTTNLEVELTKLTTKK